MLLDKSSYDALNAKSLDIENLSLPQKTGSGFLNLINKSPQAGDIITIVAFALDTIRGRAIIRKKESSIIKTSHFSDSEKWEYSLINSKLAKMEAKWESLNGKLARIKTLEEGLNNLNAQFSQISTKMNGGMSNMHYQLSKELTSFNDKFHEFKADLDSKIDNTNKKLEQINHFASTFELKIKKIGHLELMQNLDNAGFRIAINPKIIESVQKEASERIYGNSKACALDKNSVLWIVTPESLPEKAGGLAEVPTEIAQNLRKIGIKAQTILPLYESVGVSRLTETDDGYEYFYGLNKPNPSRFRLLKVVDLEIPAYKDGKYKNQRVEILFKEASEDDPDSIEKIYIKNSDYFKTAHMYKSTVTADEPERFAFFSKVVYEFMKLTVDEKSQTCLRSFAPEVFARILPPDGMILNDWHGASIAALLRYKSPIEGHFGELDVHVSKKFRNMPIVNIIHNADYKGLSYENSSNMLNTLFDKYAADIYENAYTGWAMHGLWNTLTLGDNDSVCLANMGACLSDTVVPVSETYATELATQPERSGWMQHVFAERYRNCTMRGIINGWDLDSKQVNEANLKELNLLLNADKTQIASRILREVFATLEPYDKKEAFKILNDKEKDFSFKIKLLGKIKNKKLKQTIKELKNSGCFSFREYKAYTPSDSDINIFSAIRHNRLLTLDYLNSIVEYDAKHSDNKLFGVVDAKNTDVSYVNENNMDLIPVLGMASRFVSQKGIDILALTIKKLDARWDFKFQGLPRPVFVIGGQDYESGKIKKILREAKKSLGHSGKYLVCVDGFAPGSIYQAGCTHYLYPSWFEPCGSQAEAMAKGSVPIATKVGGLADMIKHNETGYLTHINEKNAIDMARQNLYYKGIDPYCDKGAFDAEKLDIMAEAYLEQIENALCDFYFNHPKYQQMVLNAMSEDFSWISCDKNGNLQGSLLKYLDEFGI